MRVLQLRNYVRSFRKISILLTSKSIQKRLGYSKKTKLLIIHADDLGLSNSENEASIIAFEKGIVNSGSIMVNCPYFQNMVDYHLTHKQVDLGIHLTLTSEWNSYKWGPILPAKEVSSLVNADGYFFESREELYKSFVAPDVENELRAQINLAIKSGIDLTHIDSHMSSAIFNFDIQKIYIKLGKEFKLPVLLSHDIFQFSNLDKKRILVNKILIASPEDFLSGIRNYYLNALKSIQPGLSCILVHPAFNNKEMQDITQKKQNYGAIWRQADFDFFTSDECRQIIKNSNIQLITWREIRDKLIQ